MEDGQYNQMNIRLVKTQPAYLVDTLDGSSPN